MRASLTVTGSLLARDPPLAQLIVDHGEELAPVQAVRDAPPPGEKSRSVSHLKLSRTCSRAQCLSERSPGTTKPYSTQITKRLRAFYFILLSPLPSLAPPGSCSRGLPTSIKDAHLDRSPFIVRH